MDCTEAVTGFISLSTKKKILCKTQTLRIEKNFFFILSTDQLHFLCCLARRPAN